MIMIEITGAIDAAGTTQTFYLGTDGFVTSPTDTPANTAFLPVLQDPGSIGTSAYADSSTTGGATKLQSGEIVLANADGTFDAWIGYSFDGRPVTIRYGTGGAYPAAWTTLFVGTVESVEANWKNLVIRLRDKQYLFDLPILTTKYAGTNSGPTGLEGTATDLKDRVKPLALGLLLQISPPCVNTSTLTYQVSNSVVNDIPAVYDRGVSLTKGANYANNAALQAASLAGGSYGTCFAEGTFRLASTPAGQITADVTQGAAAANRTVAQLIKQLATMAGLTAGEISSVDVSALDTLNSAVVGIWLSSESDTYLQAMDQIAASLGVWYGFDAAGVLRMGVLTEPAGSPVLDLHEYDFADSISRHAARDNGIPVWTVKLSHSKVWTVQTDLAGSVPAATRAYLAQEYRYAEASDAAVKTQYKLAKKMELAGLLTDATAAATEAARQLALQKVTRSIYEVTVPVDLFNAGTLKFMDPVQITASRFGLSSGKMFRLIGIRLQLANSQMALTLWG